MSFSAESEDLPLLFPVKRKIPLETAKGEGRGNVALCNSAYDIGGQQGQADDSGNVSPAQFFPLRQGCHGGDPAAEQALISPQSPGQRPLVRSCGDRDGGFSVNCSKPIVLNL